MIILLLFHPIQVIAYNLLGSKAQQKVIYFLNATILLCFRIAGTSVKYNDTYNIPHNSPMIIIANHQSIWDITGIYWFLRRYRPLFVSKIEIAKGVPSISYNLRKSGSALINRKDRKQAIREILKVGEKATKENRAVVIFPEGTRSRKDSMKDFALGGISGLVKKMPEAMILPVCIKGTGNLEANKYNRIKAFKKISWTVVEPFSIGNMTPVEIAERSHKQIAQELSK